MYDFCTRAVIWTDSGVRGTELKSRASEDTRRQKGNVAYPNKLAVPVQPISHCIIDIRDPKHTRRFQVGATYHHDYV